MSTCRQRRSQQSSAYSCVQGHKRWVLFPPGTPRHLVLPHLPGLEREAVSWFSRVYPLTQQPGWPTARPIEIVQVRLLPAEA